VYLQCLNTTICANSLLFETLFILGAALNEQRCRSRRTETSYSTLSALELAVKGKSSFPQADPRTATLVVGSNMGLHKARFDTTQ
jgi:hypothetical protein